MKGVTELLFGIAIVLIPSYSIADGPLPFDLVWNATDPNGVPANPSWGYQITRRPADPLLPDPGRLCNNFSNHSSGSPPCTTQPIWWEPGGDLCDDHVNWQTVEYNGALYWNTVDGHSNPLLDDDYNFWLAPPSLTTLSTASPQVLALEFDSSETIDNFHTPWWDSFHSAVDDLRGNVVDTDYAIVIGLLGLDCQHSCGTEIHPVYAMAIHDPFKRSPDDDVWAIFVRNWGDEGFCASGANAVNLTSITFKLPWREHADSVDVATSIFKSGIFKSLLAGILFETPPGWQASGPSVSAIPGDGVSVTFTLPVPISFPGLFQGAFSNGELHLKWSGPGLTDHCASIRARLRALQDELNALYSALPANKADITGVVTAAERQVEAWHAQHDQELTRLEQALTICENSRRSTPAAALRLVPPSIESTPERRIWELFNKLPLDRRMPALTRIGELKGAAEDRTILMPVPARVLGPREAATVAPTQPLRDYVAAHPSKAEKDRLRKEILCAAFSNNIPEFPRACR
jgi:hypothetical protein